MRARGTKGVMGAACMGLALVVAGCESNGGTAGSGAETPAAREAHFPTQSDQFSALLRAGLSGDYQGFATHLRSDAPETVVAELSRSFGGQGFDVYTAKVDATPSVHRRLVELRSTTGRLYLYLQLDKVAGGWHVAAYELSRNRAAISAKL